MSYKIFINVNSALILNTHVSMPSPSQCTISLFISDLYKSTIRITILLQYLNMISWYLLLRMQTYIQSFQKGHIFELSDSIQSWTNYNIPHLQKRKSVLSCSRTQSTLLTFIYSGLQFLQGIGNIFINHISNLCSLTQHTLSYDPWKYGSAVKSTVWSSKGPELKSQQ